MNIFAKFICQFNWENSLKYTRTLPTDELKRLWDGYDGAEVGDRNTSGEAVHAVLNERGEGEYCAV